MVNFGCNMKASLRTRIILVVVLVAVAVLLLWRQRCQSCDNVVYQNTIRHKPELTLKLIQISKNLREIQLKEYHSSHLYNTIESQNKLLKDVINELRGENANLIEQTVPQNEKPSVKKQEVCPEEHKGEKLVWQYPNYGVGFARVDCKEFIPIEKLLTLLITMQDNPSKPAMDHLEFLTSVVKYYPKIPVILATKEPLKENVLSSVSAKLDFVFKNHVIKQASQSEVWKSLLGSVETPYVFVGANMSHFDDDTNLERLVRMVSYDPSVAVAGGAHRNITGHWDIGCQQVAFRNWTARYQGGYYQSFNDCVVCDYISGPFVAKTDTLKNVSIDTRMNEGVFHDLFWRIRKQKGRNVIVSCPDIMFNTLDREIEDVEYVPFANKHKIHKLVEPSGRVRWYGCRNGRPYTSGGLCSTTKGIGLSPASMENLADAVKFTMIVCEKSGAFCEFKDGSIVGAVKFNGVLPWERDADIIFLMENFTVLEKLAEEFKKAGYPLSIGNRPKSVHKPDDFSSAGYFAVRTTGWRIELWGRRAFETQMLTARGQVPTKVLFVGQYVNVPRNPGFFARYRYGARIYRHQEHSGVLGISGTDFYSPGAYSKCPEPGHSACLDNYPGDGNMQFRDYPTYLKADRAKFYAQKRG